MQRVTTEYTKYTDSKLLRDAVTSECEKIWLEAVGRPWSFVDRVRLTSWKLNEEDQLEAKIAEDLANALEAALRFTEEIPARDPLGIHWLPGFVTRHFGSLRDNKTRNADGDFIVLDELRLLAYRFRQSERQPGPREGVILMLGDVHNPCGVPQPATKDVIAAASILVGNMPEIKPADMNTGITVANALRREKKTIRQAIHRLPPYQKARLNIELTEAEAAELGVP